ncbi:MAG TPA: ADP-forming succinate--CoA ligase subunit beta [Actinomycetota bacterium]|nr:ADP-forming succinate--CoA ligase subunit beta [Actinomycetota bacterium]
MDLYEHMGKDLFRAHAIATPHGIVATSPEEAATATAELGGRSVVKVQVQVGGRGKGGGVVLVDSPERAAEEAARMLGSDFKEHEVTQVLVEELLPIAREFYTSVLLDRSTGGYLAMMTAEGGVDIETLAVERPEALRRVGIDPALGLRPWHVRELTATLPPDAREGAGEVLRKVWDLLGARDLTLVEVNPLVQLEDGAVVALDAKVTVDDNALFRHPDLEVLSAQFPIDPVEARAREADLQYVKLDGEVGIIGNGAGLVMSTLDVVAQAGGRAANFLDVGGGASAEKMATSLQVVLSDPAVRCVFINIFGGITRCDVVAAGILGALDRVEARVPLVVRLDGTNAAEGRRILGEAAHPRIVPVATMDDAAAEAARLAGAAA